MTLNEARQKVAINNEYNNWAMLVRFVGQNQIGLDRIESEVEELYRAHWEAVGIKKGMEQALEVVKSANRVDPGDGVCESDKDGKYIDREFLIDDIEAAIEQSTSK